MIRRLPLVPTLLVLAAVGVMLRLGFWQLDRMAQKEALLSRYEAAGSLSAEVRWPLDAAEADERLYRRASLDCARPSSPSTMAGQDAGGEAGVVHTVDCALASGGSARGVLGWSRDPANVTWSGGQVSGWIAPGPRLVADPPLAGLAASKVPDPAELPNNHFAYAVQWFLFAATALAIHRREFVSWLLV
ncbi:MAG TPA: SURF1 family cytochrome oxidase biogenesis protein, partial [Novosphingobium sp.]|nr:SURF1 family cytochrome oxidase biogenesis protein [Novosphingobium sp.]